MSWKSIDNPPKNGSMALDGMYLTRVNELDRMKSVFSDNERDVILDAANMFWNLSTKINNQLP